MRARIAIASCLASVACGAGLVACMDLFHSTSGILPGCELDAQACASEAGVPPPEASVDAGLTDFCAWSSDTARANAQHACAWLGACESPMGDNAFGACMFQALLAYDCASNPDHRVHGKAHDRWDCLWRARSCADVDACIFDGVTVQCTGSLYTACVSPGSGGPASDVRIECVDGGAPRGESCALWAQTCATDGTQAQCAGAANGLSCTPGTDTCDNGRVHSCPAGRDVGFDCSGNGAGGCNGFPPGDAGWVACVPESDGGACTPSTTPSCTGGVAHPCPTGAAEQIDCATLLQPSSGAATSCNPQPNAPAFDWTSACVVSPPAPPCEADGGDFCTGEGGLTSCARGAPFTVDCAQQGLGGCQMVTTDVGTAQRAACSAP